MEGACVVADTAESDSASAYSVSSDLGSSESCHPLLSDTEDEPLCGLSPIVEWSVEGRETARNSAGQPSSMQQSETAWTNDYGDQGNPWGGPRARSSLRNQPQEVGHEEQVLEVPPKSALRMQRAWERQVKQYLDKELPPLPNPTIQPPSDQNTIRESSGQTLVTPLYIAGWDSVGPRHDPREADIPVQPTPSRTKLLEINVSREWSQREPVTPRQDSENPYQEQLSERNGHNDPFISRERLKKVHKGWCTPRHYWKKREPSPVREQLENAYMESSIGPRPARDGSRDMRRNRAAIASRGGHLDNTYMATPTESRIAHDACREMRSNYSATTPILHVDQKFGGFRLARDSSWSNKHQPRLKTKLSLSPTRLRQAFKNNSALFRRGLASPSLRHGPASSCCIQSPLAQMQESIFGKMDDEDSIEPMSGARNTHHGAGEKKGHVRCASFGDFPPSSASSFYAATDIYGTPVPEGVMKTEAKKDVKEGSPVSKWPAFTQGNPEKLWGEKGVLNRPQSQLIAPKGKEKKLPTSFKEFAERFKQASSHFRKHDAPIALSNDLPKRLSTNKGSAPTTNPTADPPAAEPSIKISLDLQNASPKKLPTKKFAISLPRNIQMRLYGEVEYMLQEVVNDFVMGEVTAGRISVKTVQALKKTWANRGRAEVVEFFYDVTTQYKFVAHNIDTVFFQGANADDFEREYILGHAWKDLVRELGVHTFCAADVALKKMLGDCRMLFESLGADRRYWLQLQQIELQARNSIAQAEQERQAEDERQATMGIPKQIIASTPIVEGFKEETLRARYER